MAAGAGLWFVGLGTMLLGCIGIPSPLAPSLRGSVGIPHQGVLTDAVELAPKGQGYRRLRHDARAWGTPHLVAAIQNAAAAVMKARPGAPLVVGDLSPRFGGLASGHRSHRTGRDADLLYYCTSPDGRSIPSPGFVRFGPDALAQVPGKKKFVRVDVEREWLLVKALVTSSQADAEWLFAAHWLEALIIEYARASGEDPELVWQAETLLLQPGDSSVHDDHLHLRVACSAEEAVTGCAGGGPQWPWLAQPPELLPLSDAELAEAIGGELLPGATRATAEVAP